MLRDRIAGNKRILIYILLSYYCLAYVLALVMAEDGTVSQVFQDNPRELVVHKIDGKWIADVARG